MQSKKYGLKKISAVCEDLFDRLVGQGFPGLMSNRTCENLKRKRSRSYRLFFQVGSIPGIKIPAAPGYQVPFAESIRKQCRDHDRCSRDDRYTRNRQKKSNRQRKADLVIIAREFLRDPYFPLRAARELGYDIEWPNQYRRAKK